MKLSNKLYKNKPHDCFKSVHGNTMKTGGLHAPSECGQFWYRWLPTDHHFIDYDEITDVMVEDIRKNIFAILNYFNKPFIFKNLNAGQRLRLIHKVYPDSKFIWMRRDPVDTIYSILKVRKKLDVKRNKWWSIKPKNYKKLLKENELEMVTKGVYSLEKQIHTDLKLFEEGNICILNYEDFYQSFDSEIKALEDFIEASPKENVTIDNWFTNQKGEKEGRIIDQMRSASDKLDWDFND